MALSAQPPKLNEILKQNRERKRASIQIAHQDTRISLAYLQALEAGEYHKFPAEVYCLGFLKKYAVYLSLDPEEMAALYKKEQASSRTVQLEEEKKKLEIDKQEKSTDLVKVLAFILVLVFVGGWWLLTVVKSPKETVKEDRYSLIRKKLSQVSQVQAVPTEALTLAAHAASNVWMRVMPDKKLAFEGFIAGGSSRTWEANQEIFVRIGNSKAVNLTLNGQPVELRSLSVKDVAEIVLTRESLSKTAHPSPAIEPSVRDTR